MQLIADSGSTKSSWRLLDNGEITSFETQGLNPFFIDETDIIKSLSSLSLNPSEIKQLYFYGAGCGAKEKWMQQQLEAYFREAEVKVSTDLLAAAHATLGNQSALVGILGTGSNLAYYDGNQLHQKTPSLGYVLGDEGSGNHLGRLLLAAFFRGELELELARKIKVSREEVLEQLKQSKTPNRYLASFAPFLFRNRSHPQISALIQQSFNDWISTYALPYSESKELHLVGSIAYYFHAELRVVAKKQGIRIGQILENPIAALSHYHLSAE